MRAPTTWPCRCWLTTAAVYPARSGPSSLPRCCPCERGTVSSYLKATGVSRTDDGTYSVELDAGWAIGGNPHGGYLMALVAKAAVDAADSPHALAVSAHFLRPPRGGPAEVRVEVVKRGRTASTVRATLWQDDKARLDTLITTGALPEDQPSYSGLPMPDMLSPEDCRARQE